MPDAVEIPAVDFARRKHFVLESGGGHVRSFRVTRVIKRERVSRVMTMMGFASKEEDFGVKEIFCTTTIKIQRATALLSSAGGIPTATPRLMRREQTSVFFLVRPILSGLVGRAPDDMMMRASVAARVQDRSGAHVFRVFT